MRPRSKKLNHLNDPLYSIFERKLSCTTVEETSEDEFVASVVNDYICFLKKQGQLPSKYIEDIREDASVEVYDMMLKKIYGYFDLTHYCSIHYTKKGPGYEY